MVIKNINKNDLIKIKDYLNNDYYRSSFVLQYIFDNYIYDIIIYILGITKTAFFSIYIDFSTILIVVNSLNNKIFEKSIEFNINHYFQTHLETIIKLNLTISYNEVFSFQNKCCYFYTSDTIKSLNNFDDDGEIYCDYLIDLNYDNILNVKKFIFSKIAENLQIPIAIRYFEKININKNIINLFINYDCLFEFINLFNCDNNLSIEEKINICFKEKHIKKNDVLKLNKILSYK